jgi:hypothetical protein
LPAARRPAGRALLARGFDDFDDFDDFGDFAGLARLPPRRFAERDVAVLDWLFTGG